MNASQLQACAKFLGEPYYTYKLKDDTVCLNRHGPRPTDAELFYALLLKAAERGLDPQVDFTPFDDIRWETFFFDSIGKIYRRGMGPTPLDALASAIEKLEQAQ